MKKSGRNSRWDVNFHIPGMNQEMGFAAGILTALFFLGGIFVWGLLFAMAGVSSVLIMVLVVSAIVLLINLYAILRIGYDGFLSNFRITYLGEVCLIIVGAYISGIHFFEIPGNGADLLYRFMEFLAFVIFAVFVAILPSVIISLCMWLVMAVFGKH